MQFMDALIKTAPGVGLELGRVPVPQPGPGVPTQGSNPGLLHCRQILYQLSYEGSPFSICSSIFYNVSFLQPT